MLILSTILTLIFLFLAGVHFNWALGGTWGFENAIPTNENGEKILNPKRIDCVIVGIGLTVFSFYYLLQLNLFSIELPSLILTIFGWIIPVIFLLRAMGDFKYFGFFKKVKTTTFGKLDSKYFSPLCLVVGVIGLVIQLL